MNLFAFFFYDANLPRMVSEIGWPTFAYDTENWKPIKQWKISQKYVRTIIIIWGETKQMIVTKW